jgi:hypothetical protein
MNITSDLGVADLDLLGIDSSLPPSAVNFPAKFNGVPGKLLWLEVVSSQAMNRIRRQPTAEQWRWAVDTYLLLCNRRQLHPFKTSTEQGKNDRLFLSLVRARLRTVIFMNETRFFERVRVMSVTREFRIRAKDFRVISKALLFPIRDPSIKSTLTKPTPGPGFQPSGNRPGVVVKKLPFVNTTIEVDFSNFARATITLIINCPSTVAPSNNTITLLTEKQLVTFVDQSVWQPLVRTYRFNGIINRVF